MMAPKSRSAEARSLTLASRRPRKTTMSTSIMARLKSILMSETRTRAATSYLYRTLSTTRATASLKTTRSTQWLRSLMMLWIKTMVRGARGRRNKRSMSSVTVTLRSRTHVCSKSMLRCLVLILLVWVWWSLTRLQLINHLLLNSSSKLNPFTPRIAKANEILGCPSQQI